MKGALFVTISLLFFHCVVSELCSSGSGEEGECVNIKRCPTDKVLDYTRGEMYPKRCTNSLQKCCQSMDVKRKGDVYNVPPGTPECAGSTGFLVPLFDCPESYIIETGENVDYGAGIIKEREGVTISRVTEGVGEKKCCQKQAFTENGAIKCNQGKGVCLPYYQCSVVVFQRFNTNPTIKECPDYWMKCCDDDTVIRKPDISDPKPASEVKGVEKCGVRNEHGIPGVPEHTIPIEAQFGEFPWMAAIYEDSNNYGDLSYKCGGSLIAPNTVLTVAHCVNKLQDRKRSIIVRLGEWDTNRLTEQLKHQDLAIDEIVIHEKYMAAAALNDIALLFLRSSANINEKHIGTICLPSKGMNFDHKAAIVTGWGKDLNDPKQAYAAILKKTELPIVPRNECQMRLRRTQLGFRFVLHESFLCAGGVLGNDACEGDGGSPLIVQGHQSHYYQAGAVAWGIGCGTQVPGAYVDIAHHRDWIDQLMLSRGIGTSHYTLN